MGLLKPNRAVKITQADVLRAKAEGLSVEAVAKARLPKRGRPIGSKNKKPIVSLYKDGMDPISDFKKTLDEWDRLDKQANTDWELIAHKQEDRLTAYIAENEELARICIMRWEEIQHLKYLVSYLEGKHEDSSV